MEGQEVLEVVAIRNGEGQIISTIHIRILDIIYRYNTNVIATLRTSHTY